MHVFFMEMPLLLVSFCDSLKMSISFGATPELRNFMRSDWIGWELLDESLPCCLVVKSIFLSNCVVKCFQPSHVWSWHELVMYTGRFFLSIIQRCAALLRIRKNIQKAST